MKMPRLASTSSIACANCNRFCGLRFVMLSLFSATMRFVAVAAVAVAFVVATIVAAAVVVVAFPALITATELSFCD